MSQRKGLGLDNRQIQSLNGLRGIAIVMVLLVHAKFPFMGVGVYGVDLFFVLSGFLITTLICREITQTGTCNLTHFWARRFLRLMPIYYAFVGVMIAVMYYQSAHGRFDSTGGWTPEWVAASLIGYFSNYSLNQHTWPGVNAVGPLWSLAVEEQFYLIWPPLCLLLAKRPRGYWIAWAFVGAIMVVRANTDYESVRYMSRLDTRGLCIVVGCAAALTAHRSTAVVAMLNQASLRWASVGALLAVMFYAGYRVDSLGDTPDYVHHLIGLPMSLLMAWVTAMLWYGPRDTIDRWLSWGPLARAGVISYGIYVYHMVVIMLVFGYRFDVYTREEYAVRLALYLLVVWVAASASYRFYESPFLRLQKRFRHARPPAKPNVTIETSPATA